MEGIEDRPDTEVEEFPEEFQCCVCLDIMYKPVVLACGHISCFWCTHKAMNGVIESNCPVCRDRYTYFPRICGLLHFLLLKLYPLAYKRKAEQVKEEEKSWETESPEFDNSLIEELGLKTEQDNATNQPTTSSQTTTSDAESPEFDNSLIEELGLKREQDNATNQPTTSSQTTTSGAESTAESSKKVLVTDLQCAICKKLLYRPIVLNCGHVYCESCIRPDDTIYQCPVCQSAHPKGIPSVCLILDQFLEEYFPKEYSARKESLAHFRSNTPSGSSVAQQEEKTATGLANLLNSQVNLHPGVGCDYCGMYPIIGLRYTCKDCVERIGFDLCENCYESSPKLPGRFNQQHTKDHQFQVIEASHLRMVLSRFGAELSVSSDEPDGGSDNDDGGIA